MARKINVETTQTEALVAGVKEYAERAKNNGRGWDILLDMIASGDVTDDMLSEIIGSTTRIQRKANNALYQWLKPYVSARKAEDKYEAAVA